MFPEVFGPPPLATGMRRKPQKTRYFRMDAFFDIVGRSLLNACPDGVDPQEWQSFRDEYSRRENLEAAEYPIQVDIELNGGCNMRCPFCLHGYEKIANLNLPREVFERLIVEAVSLGAKSLKLNYINEPLMRKDLEDCIRFAKAAGILNVYIVTNGTMLTEARAESLLGSGLTKLFVSIDAATPETYDKQRTSGQYENVVRNVKRFIEMRNGRGLRFPLVRVSFLKNAKNIHEADEFLDQWENVADIVSFQAMNEVPGQDTKLTLPVSRDTDSGCPFPFKQLVVDHKGNVQPCCKLAGKSLVVGNVDHMSLREAWDSESLRELRAMHKDGRWRTHPVCGPCMNPTGENE